MRLMKIEINNIKNILKANLELPLDGGIYGIIGGNGCGKSTLMLILAIISSPKRYNMFLNGDFDESSSIHISLDLDNGKTEENYWTVKNHKLICNNSAKICYNGVYEGSLFYGTRFEDSRKVETLLTENKLNQEITDAANYIKNNLSFILHGDYKHYLTLKKIRSKSIATEFKLSNVPFFLETDKKQIISQYRFSSGECLLVSLLNYIYCVLIYKNDNKYKKKYNYNYKKNDIPHIFIDEIEVALHPIAISRLINFLKDLVKEHPNLVIYLTSHSPEIIKSLEPKNMFLIENNNGNLNLINPCYPSYAIRDVYTHDGFDFLILVEDLLAKYFIEAILKEEDLQSSKLIHITPVGGYNNVLQLHVDLLKNNTLGTNKTIISILDGDIQDKINPSYKDLKKLFLPIECVEKLFYKIMIETKYKKLQKIINDKYFTLKSLKSLWEEHNKKYPNNKKYENIEKKFFDRLTSDLEKRNISTEAFIQSLVFDLQKEIIFDKFKTSLIKLLQ